MSATQGLRGRPAADWLGTITRTAFSGVLSCKAPCLAAGRRGLPFAELSGAHLGARRPGVCLVQLSNASPDSFPLFPWVVPMQVLAKGSLGESVQQPSLIFITFLNGKTKKNTTASFYLVSLVGSFSSISKSFSQNCANIDPKVILIALTYGVGGGGEGRCLFLMQKYPFPVRPD